MPIQVCMYTIITSTETQLQLNLRSSPGIRTIPLVAPRSMILLAGAAIFTGSITGIHFYMKMMKHGLCLAS